MLVPVKPPQEIPRAVPLSSGALEQVDPGQAKAPRKKQSRFKAKAKGAPQLRAGTPKPKVKAIH